MEKRGTVVGDRSAGAVMRSKLYVHHVGADSAIFYGASITDADLVMTDGKSLEHTGVVPDKLMIPGGSHLAAGRDPVWPMPPRSSKCRSIDQSGRAVPFVWYEDIP